MKLNFTVVLFLSLASLSFGQSPSVSPIPAQSNLPERAKKFGFSLEKYKNNNKRYFQNNQKSDKSDNGEVISIKTDLVVDDVLITDQKGKMITDLAKDDFIVTENNIQQVIEMFSVGENSSVPRSIVLVIDCGPAEAAYFKNSIEATKLLVDKLAPQDKMAIVTVDVKLLVDFTTDKTLLKKTLNSLKIDMNLVGGREFDALLAVLNEIFAAEDSHPIIIFQGDGSQAIWLKTDNDNPYRVSNSTREKSGMRWGGKMLNFGFSDVKEAIEKSRATIYSISPGIRFLGFSKQEQMLRAKISLENTYRSLGGKKEYLPLVIREFQEVEAERRIAGQTMMLRVAELSGGNLGFIERPEDGKSIYSNIFKDISNRYSIGYYPTNQQQDGKLREVKIEVRNHPEYIVTGRKAYLPE